MRNGIQVPRGKVKFYDAEKGFGFILDDEDGQSVYVHATTLPEGVTTLRPGARVEFDMVDGRRGPQVLSLQLLEPAPSVARARRQKPEDLAVMVEDLIRLLDDAGTGLRHGRYPDRGHSQKIAPVLRAVADNFEA
jgi:CspA family cold shock protein